MEASYSELGCWWGCFVEKEKWVQERTELLV